MHLEERADDTHKCTAGAGGPAEGIDVQAEGHRDLAMLIAVLKVHCIMGHMGLRSN